MKKRDLVNYFYKYVHFKTLYAHQNKHGMKETPEERTTLLYDIHFSEFHRNGQLTPKVHQINTKIFNFIFNNYYFIIS